MSFSCVISPTALLVTCLRRVVRCCRDGSGRIPLVSCVGFLLERWREFAVNCGAIVSRNGCLCAVLGHVPSTSQITRYIGDTPNPLLLPHLTQNPLQTVMSPWHYVRFSEWIVTRDVANTYCADIIMTSHLMASCLETVANWSRIWNRWFISRIKTTACSLKNLRNLFWTRFPSGMHKTVYNIRVECHERFSPNCRFCSCWEVFFHLRSCAANRS